MNNISLKELNENLTKRDIVFTERAYGAHAVLDGIYDWGFTVIHYNDVMDPEIFFYDTEYRFITSILVDEHVNYRVLNGQLDVKVEWIPGNGVHHYTYDLYKGAPIHKEHVTALLYKVDKDSDESACSRILFANVSNKKKVYYMKDDECYVQDITDTTKTVEEYLADGYALILEDFYEDNINHFNNSIVINPVLTPSASKRWR